jgi:hypothetical protein
MLCLIYARQRLKALLAEIDHLKESEFPYVHSKEALDQTDVLFRKLLHGLKQYDEQSDKGIVAQQCARTLSFLIQYLPLLGFILRSTNVRNAFEIYHPLRRLAAQVLEPTVGKKDRKTKLVLSSEWTYSPLTYTEITQLPGLVLIGMPAHESANPLLAPLAGHELGHSAWGRSRKTYWNHLKPKIKQAIINTITAGWQAKNYSRFFPGFTAPTQVAGSLEAMELWQQALTLAMKQAEESYCDFVGLRVFGESYLHAFAYLLAPKSIGQRSVRYPNMVVRSTNLTHAANTYGIRVPTGYTAMFEDLDEPPMLNFEKFRVSVADEALVKVVTELIDMADKMVTASGIPLPSDSEAERIYNKLERVMPDEDAKCLADILNAGWRAFGNDNLWPKYLELAESRHAVLNELVLKNVEIFEIKQIVKEAP